MMNLRFKTIYGLVVLIVILACITLAIAQIHQKMSLHSPTVQLKAPVVVVPMDLRSGHPTVDVNIDGKGPFSFVVDTGAEGSVISDSLMQDLKLEVKGEAMVGSPSGGQPLPGKIVQIHRLELGEAALLNFFAVAFDASNVFREEGAPRGVLSAKAFSGYLLTLDYPQKRMELRVGELPPADNAEILDYDASARLLEIPVRVAGIEIRAHLDSGSRYGVILPAKYAEQLPLNEKPMPFPKIHRVDTQSEAQHARLKGVMQLGRYTFDNPDIIFDKSAPTANVGTAILQRFRLSLDSKNHRIQLQEIPTH